MACIAFIGSIAFSGFLASFVPVDTLSSKTDHPDYHYVPYAGDSWGSHRA